MNENMKLFLKEIFIEDIENHKIRAYKFAENYKPDIIITANGISKYISIKNGECNSVHQEHIYSFIYFLETNNIPKEIAKKLLEFHFNDGTINGSGKVRKNANDFLEKEQQWIQKINKELNKESIKKELIKRILFKGEFFSIPQVDYIYYGNVEKGYWASKDSITNYLSSTYTFTSSIHISKLYYQSLHRNLKYDKYYEYKRYYVQFKWYSIKEDLKRIMKIT